MRRPLVCLLSALGLVGAAAAPSHAALSLVTVGSAGEPTYALAAPGDPSRLYVTERSGVIRVFRDGRSTLFADFSSKVSGGGERGLFSMAFDPNFDENRRFYVYYTGVAADGVLGDLVVARGVATSADSAPGTLERLVVVPHSRQSNHNGGQLQFGPDGFLYAGTGDGGSGGDPADNGQNLDSASPAVVGGVDRHPLLGKMLRIDVSPERGYASPATNAFGPGSKAPEIWAYGLRNPYRFSFDSANGNLLIGDVGQNRREEADLLAAGTPAGTNFGWKAWEGSAAFSGSPGRAGFDFPELEYGHGGAEFGKITGCSITGGYVSRDPEVPELAGRYVYGDYCTGSLRSAVMTDGNPGTTLESDASLNLTARNVISFGEDACGRVLVLTQDGAISRIASGTATTCTFKPVLPGAMAPAPPSKDAPAGTVSGGAITSTGMPVVAGPGGPAAGPGRPPLVTVRALTQRALRTNRVTVTVTCDELCKLTVDGAFRVSRRSAGAPRLALQRQRRTLDAGVRLRFGLVFSAKTRRSLAAALRDRRSVSARVRVRAVDATGETTTRNVAVRVRR